MIRQIIAAAMVAPLCGCLALLPTTETQIVKKTVCLPMPAYTEQQTQQFLQELTKAAGAYPMVTTVAVDAVELRKKNREACDAANK
jgi:hypothetical protein